MFRGRSASARPERALAVVISAGVLLVTMPATPGQATALDPFVVKNGDATIDWRRGTIEATGGAAADIRMPSADAARPGAQRRATAAARGRIADALRALPLGGGRHLDDAAVTRALGRARTADIEYQSNGGALVRLQVAFGAWSEAAPPAEDSLSPAPVVALVLPEGQLAAAPLVVVGGHEVALGCARFNSAASVPAGVTPVPARADKKGRLLIGARAASAAEFAGRAAVVYVHKVQR